MKGLLPLLAVAVMLTQTDFASSQWGSRWGGRSAVESGGMPYASDPTGSVYYPGGSSYQPGSSAIPYQNSYPSAYQNSYPSGYSNSYPSTYTGSGAGWGYSPGGSYSPGSNPGSVYGGYSPMPPTGAVPPQAQISTQPGSVTAPDGTTFTINGSTPTTRPTPNSTTPAKEEAAPNAAHIRVHVPADAKIWVFDHQTTQTGEWRHFMTPAIENGQSLSYEFRARWTENGKEVERTRSATFFPGDRQTIDFLTSDSAK
jgi:uncharacterized protein (TIGR03000 family)